MAPVRADGRQNARRRVGLPWQRSRHGEGVAGTDACGVGAEARRLVFVYARMTDLLRVRSSSDTCFRVAEDRQGRATMKIVVIDGTGLIGSNTVAILREGVHEVVAASPKNGVNSITGEGLKDAVAG